MAKLFPSIFLPCSNNNNNLYFKKSVTYHTRYFVIIAPTYKNSQRYYAYVTRTFVHKGKYKKGLRGFNPPFGYSYYYDYESLYA